MKKILLFAAVLSTITVYAQTADELQATSGAISSAADGTPYGKPFDEKGAVSMADLANRSIDKELSNITVRGKIEEVCQAEGCWIRVSKENDEGTTMLVKFKDHSFVIPKDLAGKNIVFTGRAYHATITVEMQKHYAEDAGKTKDEIAKITTPSKELVFEATGVIIK